MSSPHQGVQFSLITTTRYRSEELHTYLQSLVGLDFPKDQFEVIICDQNQAGEAELKPILAKYHDQLQLQHLKVQPLGTGYSRQSGILAANGKYLAFPDDDCVYYPDTLKNAAALFAADPKLELLLGRVFDRKTGQNLLKNWPEHSTNVNSFSFYKLYTCISVFAKKREIGFDPRFGVGAKFGSAEDADFVYQYIKVGAETKYDPSVEVWHPPEDNNHFSIEKLRSYSFGFGGFCRKNFDLSIAAIFISGLVLQIVRILIGFLTFSGLNTARAIEGLIYRLKGFFAYTK